MSELQVRLEALLQSINDKKYEGVNWSDGQEPPLSADYLNKSEAALRELLTVFKGSPEGGIIQQILRLLINEVKDRESVDTRQDSTISSLKGNLSSLETKINTTITDQTEVDTKQDAKLSTLTTTIESTNNSVKLNTSNIDSLQDSVNDINNSITDIESKMNEIEDNINIEGVISDKVVQDNDEVLLRCGSSTEILF